MLWSEVFMIQNALLDYMIELTWGRKLVVQVYCWFKDGAITGWLRSAKKQVKNCGPPHVALLPSAPKSLNTDIVGVIDQ